MNATWVFNDTHLGVRRSGGTTQASALALRAWALEQFAALLGRVGNGEDVIINGDLTDQFDIPLADALAIHSAVMQWAAQHPDSTLWIATGNHDLSKDSTKLGVAGFLGQLLSSSLSNVKLVAESEQLNDSIYVIPHCVNQAQFDLELSRVPDGMQYLLLHCNFDSPFAEHADHSLNLSRAQAEEVIAKGTTIVLGHEHHQRTLLQGRVLIPGNQFPTSIADCVTPEGRQVEEKQCLVLRESEVSRVTTWQRTGEFGFRQWDVNEPLDPAQSGFVRVVGDIEADGAAEALRKISRLRQASSAFVISNAVRVRNTGHEIEDVLAGVDDVRGIDVIQMLMDTLTPEQQEAVRAVLALRA